MLYARDSLCGRGMAVGPREGRVLLRWERDWLITEVMAACEVRFDDNLAAILECSSSLIRVQQAWDSRVDRREADALEDMLAGCGDTTRRSP